MESQLEFKDIADVVKRRRKIFFLCVIILLPFVIFITLVLPPIYRTETTLLRETQQVSEEYIRSTIDSYAEERVDAATQRVMSRSNLLKIIEQYNLYPEMRNKKTIDEIIGRMREAIHLETLYATVANERTGRATSINTAFKLSYEGLTPLKVQKVTNTLASLYIELENQTRGRRASATTTFLQNELTNLQNQLSFLEEKIRSYKESHIGELPENYRANENTLARLERELDNIESNIQAVEERKLFIEGQITTVDPLLPIQTGEGKVAINPGERLKRLRLELMSLRSTLSEKHPDIKKLTNEINELEKQVNNSDDTAIKIKRLKELEEMLSIKKGSLGSTHPDILRIEKEIKNIEADIKRNESEKSKTDVLLETADNPTYINLQTQIFIAESELKRHKINREETKRLIEIYRNRIDKLPLIEKEYNELTRDYTMTKRKYDDISGKLMEARVSKGVEESQFGERFIIVDPAPLPEKPYKPNRGAIFVLGLIITIGVGIGFAALGESMDRSIKTVDELNQITGGNVFSAVPMIETKEEKHRRTKLRIIWCAGVMGFLLIVIMAIHIYLTPLNDVWIVVKERIVNN